MPNRRNFVKTIVGAAAGMYIMGRGGADAASPLQRVRPGTNRLLVDPASARRQVMIGGRRVRVLDVHAHAGIAVGDVVKGTPFENRANDATLLEDRIALMNRQGIDMGALSINSYWWFRAKDRGLAHAICTAQNEGLAKWVATHPDRFVAMVSVPLQFPDLAAEILEDGVKRLGMRGVTLTAHVNGEDMSLPKFDVFWAKVAELGQLVFMHPQGAGWLLRDGALSGRGAFGNVIGMPLATTYFFSRLIFDGVFDRHPGLRICAGHAGGYLPSYFGRTEAACDVRPEAKCANKKRPREYLRSQMLVDTMAFSEEGLRHLVAEMGVGQVIYGTDNPYDWPVTVDLVVNVPFLSNADKEAILGGNLMKLLGIS